MSPRLWHPPQIRRDQEGSHERKATWLELFYDLIFVAAIGQLAHGLSKDISMAGLFSFVAFFIPLWWCWVGATFYATRFDSDTIADRLFTFVQMGIVAAMAVHMHHGLAAASVGFAGCYVAFRCVLLGQYAIAGAFVAEDRPLVWRYIVGFGLGIGFWLASMVVPAPWRYGLWVIGLLIAFVTPITGQALVVKLPISMTHIPERIGLFTIIVLGESIIGVVNGLVELDWSLPSILTALLGLTMAFSLWWLYFDSADGSPLRSMQRGKMWPGLTWLYAHLPLTLGLAAAGVGVEHLIADTTAVPTTAERWLVCGSIALCLMALAVLHWLTCTLGTPRFRKILSAYRLGSAAFMVILAIAGTTLSAWGLAALLAIACTIQVVFDLWRRIGQQPVGEGC